MSFDFKIENGDWKLNSTGDIQKVENTEKLVQDCLKILVTTVGSIPFHPTYGSLLGKNLIGNIFDTEFVSSNAQNAIKNSLESLQKYQRNQSLHQRVTPEEQLASIRQITVKRNSVDPRYFSVFVEIATGAFKKETLNFEVAL
jgi:phage baseplate assembly protein W